MQVLLGLGSKRGRPSGPSSTDGRLTLLVNRRAQRSGSEAAELETAEAPGGADGFALSKRLRYLDAMEGFDGRLTVS